MTTKQLLSIGLVLALGVHAACGVPEDECALYGDECGDEVCQEHGPVDIPEEQYLECAPPCETDADCEAPYSSCWSSGHCRADANDCDTLCSASGCCTYKRDPQRTGQCIEIGCTY